MKHKHLLISLLMLLLLIAGITDPVRAQGVTSATMGGIVIDSNGEELPGATIIAVHNPSGTNYGTASRVDGRFTIPGMRVGGPYTITVSFIGYETREFVDINLALGQNFNLEVTLQEEGVQLTDVVVRGTRNKILNSERTGAETQISNAQINSLPTISRGLNDFTRLTPQASVTSTGGISFAGQNNRYNQFAIDGTVNNDVFGLSASGTNGGQTGVQPISLDAIEQVQVVLAPYDVRLGGFTGGGINAITRSGTNN